MITAIERRQRILEYLSDYRHATYSELANEFGVSKNTIVTDIVELSCSAPIFTTAGRYGGGIRVADGWYVGRRYLRDDQEQLLRELMDGLQPEDQKTMQAILTAFAKPKVKEK